MSSATTFAAPIERPGLDLRSVDPSCAKTRENNGKFRFGSKDAARGVFSVRTSVAAKSSSRALSNVTSRAEVTCATSRVAAKRARFMAEA